MRKIKVQAADAASLSLGNMRSVIAPSAKELSIADASNTAASVRLYTKQGALVIPGHPTSSWKIDVGMLMLIAWMVMKLSQIDRPLSKARYPGSLSDTRKIGCSAIARIPRVPTRGLTSSVRQQDRNTLQTRSRKDGWKDHN